MRSCSVPFNGERTQFSKINYKVRSAAGPVYQSHENDDCHEGKSGKTLIRALSQYIRPLCEPSFSEFYSSASAKQKACVSRRCVR